MEKTTARGASPHPCIPLPADLYGPERRNAAGIDLSDPLTLSRLPAGMERRARWEAAPLVGGNLRGGEPHAVRAPADRGRVVGEAVHAGPEAVAAALGFVHEAAAGWNATGAAERARILRAAADTFETAAPELMALCVWEAGKTLPDAVAEVREAVDFLRYYAARAEAMFGAPVALPGPTAERNELRLAGRGVFACISPWNFPLAIFTGQVAAALAAGNGVLAKPAAQTPLIAARAVALLHGAGVPDGVLHLLPGRGSDIGARTVADERVAGVAFTGSTEVAKSIHRSLAARAGAIPTLIAETGGVNAMIVDSSALTEQVVADAIASAFHSGRGNGARRCGCCFCRTTSPAAPLRCWRAPWRNWRWATRSGCPPTSARSSMPKPSGCWSNTWREWPASRRFGSARPYPKRARRGASWRRPWWSGRFFVAARGGVRADPARGPVRAGRLGDVCEAINATGYWLTLGVHSRIDEAAEFVRGRVRAGNVYVNRTMIGAVVGAQPFGGEGLSGTGPKTGGPHTLLRYATERALSVNTAALGGNAALVAEAGEGEE